MKEVKYYVAEDGTKFDDEDECLEYESKTAERIFKDTAFLFDEKGRQLPLSGNAFDVAIYIKATTDAAARFMAEKFGDWTTPWNQMGIIKPGCWAYVNDGWVSIEEIEEIHKILYEIS